MKTEQFDVVILGGGNAGLRVTGPVRRAGLSVAMIEARDLGGTCPNRGCTPKKVLVAAGHALPRDRTRARSPHCGRHAQAELGRPDRPRKGHDQDIPQNLARAMAKRHVEVIVGRAAFVAPNTIRVGERLLGARYIVIATGSKPRRLTIPGSEHLITSDEVLGERTQPGSVIFIGGGVISLEFAHVYARAGTDVTILEALPRLLPAIDADAVAYLQAESARIGIRVRTGVSVEQIEPIQGRLRVTFTHDGAQQTLQADRVINGAGRIANVDTLDLVAGGVEHDNGRVSVDPYLRSTSNPSVFVCGDALPISPQLSPLATYEGDIVGRNIVDGPRHRPDYEGMATSVYTVPALAAVGLTEAAATRKRMSISVHVNDMLGWFSAKTYAETVAWSKLIVDKATDRILGAHFVGHGGQELVNMFGLAIRFGISASELKDFVYAYPTFSADIKHMFGHS